MPANFGTTPTSTTTLATNEFPVSAGFVPNTASGDLTSIQLGPATTDSNGYTSAPVAVYQATGTNLHVVVDSGSITDSGTVTANQGGSWTVTANAGTGTFGVSGTVTANAGSGTFTNQQSNNTADYDTGVGTQTMTMFGLALPASGGAVAGGTASNPVRTDPTGTTTQPISGTVTANAGSGTFTVSGTVTANAGTNLNTSALALETGGNLASVATNTTNIPNVVGTAGSAIPSKLLQVGGSDGTNARAIKTDSSGNVAVNVQNTPTVTANAGTGTFTIAGAVTQSGTWTVQPGNTANTTPWLVQEQAGTAGGSTPYHNISANSTNFTNVKGAACQMYGYSLSNTSASAIYVKFYDKATAPGTGDTPKDTVQVPANGTVLRAFPVGLKFSSGFGWGATGAVGDSDNTAIAANCVIDFDLSN